MGDVAKLGQMNRWLLARQKSVECQRRKKEEKLRGWDESERSDVFAATTHDGIYCTDWGKGSVEIFANVANVTLRDEILLLIGRSYFMGEINNYIKRFFQWREKAAQVADEARRCPAVNTETTYICRQRSEVRVMASSSSAAFLLEMCKDPVNKQSHMKHMSLLGKKYAASVRRILGSWLTS